jgi:hypothetical protein
MSQFEKLSKDDQKWATAEAIRGCSSNGIKSY